MDAILILRFYKLIRQEIVYTFVVFNCTRFEVNLDLVKQCLVVDVNIQPIDFFRGDVYCLLSALIICCKPASVFLMLYLYRS